MTPAEELRAARAAVRPLCPACRRRPMHVGAGSWQGRCAPCLGLTDAEVSLPDERDLVRTINGGA